MKVIIVIPKKVKLKTVNNNHCIISQNKPFKFLFPWFNLFNEINSDATFQSAILKCTSLRLWWLMEEFEGKTLSATFLNAIFICANLQLCPLVVDGRIWWKNFECNFSKCNFYMCKFTTLPSGGWWKKLMEEVWVQLF